MENSSLRPLIARLHDWRRAGVTHVRLSPSSAVPYPQEQGSAAIVSREPVPVAELPTAINPIASDSMSPEKALAVIQREVAQCTACPELVQHRTQTVFGVGNPRARLCFMGEAPGADEDRQGEPFVGRAGQLLTKIIEACKLTRQDVYILNTIKCRPPGNRNPGPDEIRNCRGFLDRQLEVIQPEFICCLGAVAAHALLDVATPISRLRGRFLDYQGFRVICTFHPAYLLRNPAAKKETWEDMKLLMRAMGVEL